MMGSAVAFDLARHGAEAEVILADIDGEAARRSAAAIGDAVKPLRCDVNSLPELRAAMDGSSVVVSAVSYAVNETVTRAAIDAGIHMVDLGGNNDVVRRQLALDRQARDRGVTIIPDSGLAPGLINILGASGAREFDSVDSIQLRVGGLPQRPRPPLNYEIVFSAEGLINEYIEKATVVRDGKIVVIDSMTELEQIEFPPPFGTLEAFTTSGGVSQLPELFAGKVRSVDYKTIRYPGHCEKFKTLLDLGFAGAEPVIVGGQLRTARELFTQLLRKKLETGGPDVVLARATVTGMRDARRTRLVYEFIDYYDEKNRMTAMMRTTAFPTAILAAMLASGSLSAPGVHTPEACVPAEPMITALKARAIHISQKLSEL
jgi:lysine 6-dehydrogenase